MLGGSNSRRDMTKPYSADTEAIETTLIALMHAFASALHEIFRPTGYGSAAYKAQLAREQELLDASEAALRRKHGNAIFQRNDIERRAAEHGIVFSLHAEPHHRAAILDFLDDPRKPTHLHGMHATWFHARGDNGRSITSLAHPANRAAFEITRRCIVRHGYESAYYTAEKSNWTGDQWLDFERAERARRMDPLRPQIPKGYYCSTPNDSPKH